MLGGCVQSVSVRYKRPCGRLGALGGLTRCLTFLLPFNVVLLGSHILVRFLLATLVESYFADGKKLLCWCVESYYAGG